MPSHSCITEDGYDIEYVRVPVTDEKAPKDNDVDLLVQRVWRIAEEDEQRVAQGQEPSAIVFNCQMGRGRTTTGMIIASMVLLRKHIRTNPGASVTHDVISHTHVLYHVCQIVCLIHVLAPTTAFIYITHTCPDVLPPWFNLQELMVSPRSPSNLADEEAALKDGQFGVVRSLLRVLDHGQASKAMVDAVIDSCRSETRRHASGVIDPLYCCMDTAYWPCCLQHPQPCRRHSAMQNLREAIATYRSRLLKESNDGKREALLQVCLSHNPPTPTAPLAPGGGGVPGALLRPHRL